MRKKFKDGWYLFFYGITETGIWMILRTNSTPANRCMEFEVNTGVSIFPVVVHIMPMDFKHWMKCKRKHLKEFHE